MAKGEKLKFTSPEMRLVQGDADRYRRVEFDTFGRAHFYPLDELLGEAGFFRHGMK